MVCSQNVSRCCDNIIVFNNSIVICGDDAGFYDAVL